MTNIWKGLSVIAFGTALTWLYQAPALNSGLASLTTLVTMIGIFASSQKKSVPTQSQSVGDSGIGIQAGGNVKIGSIESPDK